MKKLATTEYNAYDGSTRIVTSEGLLKLSSDRKHLESARRLYEVSYNGSREVTAATTAMLMFKKIKPSELYAISMLYEYTLNDKNVIVYKPKHARYRAVKNYELRLKSEMSPLVSQYIDVMTPLSDLRLSELNRLLELGFIYRK